MPYPEDPELRAATLELLGRTWLKLPDAIAQARTWGADWCEVSTPFIERVDDRVVAHVGVIELPWVVDGRPRTLAGIHAVCTRKDMRGRGHMRAAMTRALAWADQRYDGAALWANDPAIYAQFGFVAQPESMFVGPVRGGPERVRSLNLDRAEDLALVRERCDRRVAISQRSGVVGATELALIDLALWQGPSLAYVPKLDCVVAYAVRERFLDLYDVLATRELSLAELAAQLGERIDTAVVHVSPDRLDAPQLRAEPTVLLDTLMVRGLQLSEPAAVPPLSRC